MQVKNPAGPSTIDSKDLYTIKEELKEEYTETARFESLVKGISQISLDITDNSNPMGNMMHLRDELKTPDTIVRKRNYYQMIGDNICKIVSPNDSFFNLSSKRNKVVDNEESYISFSKEKEARFIQDSDSESVVTMCKKIVDQMKEKQQDPNNDF